MKHCLAKISSKEFVDNKFVFNKMLEACHRAGLTVMSSGKHEFSPGGLTAFIIIGESHMSIHTYPEKDMAYLDCFTCGKVDPNAPIKIFIDLINGRVVSLKTHERDDRC